jgi:Fe-S cluster biogenesis protein NfuA
VNKAATVEDQVKEALELIRPAIQMDGGDIQLASVRDGAVLVKLFGTCEGCPISPVTLKQGVERLLKEKVPGITEVIAIEA